MAPGPAFASEVSVRAVVPQVEVPGPDPPPTPEGSLSTIHALDQWGSPLDLLPSFSFLESASQDDLRVPSMRWGTQPFPAVWQLPTTWQDCWRLWAALHFSHKWSRSVWRHCRRSQAAGRRICGLPGEFCCRPASARQSVCCPFAMWLPPWEMLEVCGAGAHFLLQRSRSSRPFGLRSARIHSLPPAGRPPSSATLRTERSFFCAVRRSHLLGSAPRRLAAPHQSHVSEAE